MKRDAFLVSQIALTHRSRRLRQNLIRFMAERLPMPPRTEVGAIRPPVARTEETRHLRDRAPPVHDGLDSLTTFLTIDFIFISDTRKHLGLTVGCIQQADDRSHISAIVISVFEDVYAIRLGC